MEKLKVLLNGCNGGMGHEVVKAAEKNEDFEIMCGVDKEDLKLYSFPTYTNFEDVEGLPDVIIDFSVPVATLNALHYARERGVPIVIATTGFSDDQYNEIVETSNHIPVFQSYNMSFDIFLMQKVVKMVSQALQNTDIEIVETHHNRKIDAPSGTALMLADAVNEACEHQYSYNMNRLNESKKRDKKEIGFSSIRGGNIVGEHTIKFMGDNDTFEITHKAYSRQLFAEGAFRAAKYIIGKPCRLYNMNNLA